MGELYSKNHEIFKLARELNNTIRELSRNVGGTAAEVVGEKPDGSPLMPKRPNSAAGKVLSRAQAKMLEDKVRRLEALWNEEVSDLRDQQKLREILAFDKLEALLVSLARGAQGPKAGEVNDAKSPISEVKSILRKIHNNPPTTSFEELNSKTKEHARSARRQQELRDEEARRKKAEDEAAERQRQEQARQAKEEAERAGKEERDRLKQKKANRDTRPKQNQGERTGTGSSPVANTAVPISQEDLKQRAENLRHGPKVEVNYEDEPTADNSSAQITVGYYERLKKVEQKEHIVPNVKPYIHLNNELTEQELAGLKTRATSRVQKFGGEQPIKIAPTNKEKWGDKSKEWDDKLKSAQKVYHEAKITENTSTEFKMTFIGKDSLNVGLQDKGVALTFSSGIPSPNALVAGAEIINDAVKMSQQKKQKIVGLVIKDYESNLLGGLTIFCSLACQDKPVRFDGNALSAATSDNVGYFEVAQYLQALAKTKTGRDQLMHMVEDDNITLKTMVDWAKNKTPRPGITEFAKQFEAGHSMPKPGI